MEKIFFKTVDNENLNLWVYDEGNPLKDKERSALIWIHGGGWNSGSPDYFGDDYDYFTKLGAVCFGVEYRLVSKTENDPQAVRLQGAFSDCIDAIMFIKQNANKFGVSADKIVVIGESAGGHLALCTATSVINRFNKEAVPNAVVAINPVLRTIDRWSESAARIEGLSLGVDEFYNRYKILKEVSPSDNIEKNNIPLLLLTGIDDKCVYPGEVVDFFERYIACGNKADIELYPNTGHAFTLPFWYDNDRISLNKALNKMEKFLYDLGYIKSK